MKTAWELYPDQAQEEFERNYFYGPSDYQPMLEEFGEIIIQVDDMDYHGDSRILYKDGNRFGYLQFGWGSCSGCDALQACNSMREIQELMDELRDKIMWFESRGVALAFFQTHDWPGDYSWHYEEQRDFVQKVIAFLGAEQ